jgi:hypothetical protein
VRQIQTVASVQRKCSHYNNKPLSPTFRSSQQLSWRWHHCQSVCVKLKVKMSRSATCRIISYKRCCRLVGIPALCFRGLVFKFGPGDRLSRLRFFVVFLSLSRRMPGQSFKSGHTASFYILSNDRSLIILSFNCTV